MSTPGGPQEIPRPEKWEAGGPPPWVDANTTSFDVATIEAMFSSYEPRDLPILRVPDVPLQPPRTSAVLVSVYDGPAGATTILTRRPLHMRNHPGQVAFPGGVTDDDDKTSWATAVREAHEEIDLHPSQPRQIGALDRFVTGGSFSLVAPMLAALDTKPDLTAAPDEVEAILHVPLIGLLRPDVYRHERWSWQGEVMSVHFFELVGDTVWGATALILHRLLELLTERT